MCCGRGRLGQGFSGMQPPRTVPGLARPPGVTFEYVGRTRLIVTGPVTGRQYRFDRPGSQLEVDPRDSTSIARIPLLRKGGPPAPRR
jgi:hypothetical protein